MTNRKCKTIPKELFDDPHFHQMFDFVSMMLYDDTDNDEEKQTDVDVEALIKENEELKKCCTRQVEEITRLKTIEEKYSRFETELQASKNSVINHDRDIQTLNNIIGELQHTLENERKKAMSQFRVIEQLQTKLKTVEVEAEKYRELRRILS